jgi:nitrous oxidase accessory protein NosD
VSPASIARLASTARHRAPAPAVPVLLAALAVLLSSLPGRALAQAAPCSVSVAPGQSLRAAIASTPAGGVICLAAGLYSETPVFDQTTPPALTLRGAGPEATILDGLGGHDGVLILNTGSITLENLGLRGGVPANAYVYNSRDIRFRNVAVSGGGIGIHIDAGSNAEVSDSLVTGVSTDGVLIRSGSSAAILSSEIRGNGGVGVSAVGNVGRVQLSSNEVASNRGPGFFAGQTPCQLLAPATVEPPPCFLANPSAFVASGQYHLNDNTFEDNGSTGLVFFPGTKAALFHNRINDNRLTGLFVWGADVSTILNRFERNQEHAAEYRAYPAPRLPGQPPGTIVLKATGSFLGNVVQDTAPLGTILGGGLLLQGGRLVVRDNSLLDNAGIGVSFVNGAEGEIASNYIMWNKGSAICLFHAGSVDVGKNTIGGNLADKVGVCAEQRH